MRLAAQEKGNDVGASIPTSKRTPPAISWPQFRISYAMYSFFCGKFEFLSIPDAKVLSVPFAFVVSKISLSIHRETIKLYFCTSHRKYVRVRDAETGVSLLICKINLT